MKKILFGLITSSLLFMSCSKDDDPSNPAADNYMSTTTGNSWNYAYVDNTDATNNYNYTLTSTNRDSTAAGRIYHVFTSSDGANEYYNITGNEYYTFQAFSLAGADTTITNLYLKTGAAVNTSWVQTYTLDAGVPVDINVTNKIAATGVTKVVGAKTYNDVIDVVTTIAIPALAADPTATFTTNIHYYYAPKYGMIQNDAKIDLVSGLLGLNVHTDDKTTLTSANF